MPNSVVQPSRNLIVACIEDHPKAVILLRTARRRAQEKGCKWRAVFVERPSSAQEEGSRERVLRLLTLAEQMGGESLHMQADTTEKGLELLLEKESARIVLVVVGSTEAEGRLNILRILPWMRVVRLASRYTQVEVVQLSGQNYRRSFIEKLHLRHFRPQNIAYALGAVAVAYVGALFLQWILPPALFRINEHNIALLFMIACAFSAGRYGMLPGLVASIASFATVNYYFVVPYHSLKMNTVTDALNMGLFLFAALFISLFTSQTREYAQKAAKRELSTQALFSLYRLASESFSREKALEKLQQRLERMLDLDVAFFLPQIMHPERIDPAFPAGLELTEEDRKAVDVCWSEMKTTGVASPFNPGSRWRFEPMVSPAGEIGVIAIRPRKQNKLDAWSGRLLAAIADQTASVLEHIELERSMGETRIREEREKLRAMLLSSVSHDFKTPLAGIIGALSVHRSLGERLPEQKRNELVESAIEEAQRLDSFITNILDMTRLEAGNIQFHQDWNNLDASIANVLKRLQHRCRKHVLEIFKGPDYIDVYMDAMLTEQVIQNILDNACKYTAVGTQIEIHCTLEENKGVYCSIRDHGPGLPKEKIDRVFDKYERLLKKDTQVAGTGLGLAIGKAIMEAQGGWITAANHPEGGAVFTLFFPQWRVRETKTVEEISDGSREQAYRRH